MVDGEHADTLIKKEVSCALGCLAEDLGGGRVGGGRGERGDEAERITKEETRQIKAI